jgi:hypothetical protein
LKSIDSDFVIFHEGILADCDAGSNRCMVAALRQGADGTCAARARIQEILRL